MYERLRELELAGMGKKRLRGDLGTWQEGMKMEEPGSSQKLSVTGLNGHKLVWGSI